jgi:hypothetical protein
MAVWERLRLELDRAGRTAADAVDEGRLRLDLYRARQTADRFAQKLGYAVHHARTAGGDVAAEEYVALSQDLRAAEAEVARYETLVAQAAKRRQGANVPAAKSSPPAPPTESTSPPAPPIP